MRLLRGGTRLNALLVLALLQLVSFGVFSTRVGFYHDDWTNLERLQGAGGVWGGMRLYAGTVLERPLEILQYPLFYAIGGLDPFRYQVLFFCLDLLGGFLLFELLERVTRWRGLALLASALALIYPNHAVTHFWFSSSAQTIAIDLALASLLLHLRWLQSRERRWLFGSFACYLLAIACYEGPAFFPLILAGGFLARQALSGKPVKDALARLAVEAVPYCLALAALLAWRRLGAQYFLRGNPRPVELSLAHFIRVFSAGIGSISFRTASLCAKVVLSAARESRLAALLGAALVAAAAGFLLDVGDAPVKSRRRTLGEALGMAIGGFLAANLPYAFSASYTPIHVGIMGRTSANGAIVGGLLLAVGLLALSSRAVSRGGPARLAPRAVLSLVVWAFTLANWHQAGQWARSWSLQKDILSKARSPALGLPRSATLLLANFPSYIDEEITGALVFDSNWDFSSAIRLATGRRDLSANVVTWRMIFYKDRVIEAVGPKILSTYRYPNLFLYDYGRNRLLDLNGPQGPAGRPV